MIEKYVLLLICILVCGINAIIGVITEKMLFLLISVILIIIICVTLNNIIEDS